MNKSLFIACLLLSHSVFAKTLISPPSRPIMLELYTSQGCSSCPPAERWLASVHPETYAYCGNQKYAN